MKYKIIVKDSRIDLRNSYDWILYLTAKSLVDEMYGRKSRLE